MLLYICCKELLNWSRLLPPKANSSRPYTYLASDKTPPRSNALRQYFVEKPMQSSILGTIRFETGRWAGGQRGGHCPAPYFENDGPGPIPL